LEFARDLMMTVCDTRNGMPSMSILSKDMHPLDDAQLSSLKGAPFDTIYSAVTSQYSLAVKQFVHNVLNGAYSRAGLFEAMTKDIVSHESHLWDKDRTCSGVATRLEYTKTDHTPEQFAALPPGHRYALLTSKSSNWVDEFKERLIYLSKRVADNVHEKLEKLGLSSAMLAKQKAKSVIMVVDLLEVEHNGTKLSKVPNMNFDGTLEFVPLVVVEVLLTLTIMCLQTTETKRDQYDLYNKQMDSLSGISWASQNTDNFLQLTDTLAGICDNFERLDGLSHFGDKMMTLADAIEGSCERAGNNLSTTTSQMFSCIKPLGGVVPAPFEQYQALQALSAHIRLIRIKNQTHDNSMSSFTGQVSPEFIAALHAGKVPSAPPSSRRGALGTRANTAVSQSTRSHARDPPRSQARRGTPPQPSSAPAWQTRAPAAAPSGRGSNRPPARAGSLQPQGSTMCKWPKSCFRVGRKYADSGKDMCQFRHSAVTDKGSLEALCTYNRSQPPIRSQQGHDGSSSTRATAGAPRTSQRHTVGAISTPIKRL
jgi:hypothetical protein